MALPKRRAPGGDGKRPLLLRCTTCQAEFYGKSGQTLCPACAQESKDSVHIRKRTCRTCTASFDGGPRAWYCPSCREERRKKTDAAAKARARAGKTRKLGSIGICQVCGKEYIVEGGLQKYCPECAPEAVAKIKRKSSIEWNLKNVDNAKRTEARQSAIVDIECVICGNLFKPHEGSPITCSAECSAELARRNFAEWEAKNRQERLAYQRERQRRKLAAMTPEEYTKYRDAVNARARENHRKRKLKFDKS